MGLVLNAAAFRQWTQLCVAALAESRAEIDALNVFPVPDSDTGTNAYLTFVAGADALADLPADTPLAEVVPTYLTGLLTGARGNCGVICAQLVQASFTAFGVEGALSGADVAKAFESASEAAYAAVGQPKEGTILSVAKAASESARAAANEGKGARGVMSAAAAGARDALDRTPMQMELLARAGVVDAGGRALVVLFDATEQALTGKVPPRRAATVPVPVQQVGEDLVAGGPSYEVMYLLTADESAIVDLRATLAGLGDSLVVVGGGGLWNVHVHVDDVGAAIEAGLAAGRPYRIAVTHFADQIARQRQLRRHRVVVAATTGPGITALTREAGAQALEFTREKQLTTEAMVAAIAGADADEVVVLPNNPRYVKLFEAAASEARRAGVRVAVIPTLAQVQGLTALAVHDPGVDFDDDVVTMSSSAAATAHGAVTIAAEEGMTSAGVVQPGDVLGVVDGDFAIVGSDQLAVALDVVQRLLKPMSELVTLVVGADATPDLADALEREIARARPEIDVTVYDGGQENYPLFVAVE